MAPNNGEDLVGNKTEGLKEPRQITAHRKGEYS
jgi:hypothetical protein